MSSFSLHVSETRDVSEYHDSEKRPNFITHKGKRYKVHGTVLSWDAWGSDVRIWVPVKIPGRKLLYIYHHINFRDLTKPQRRKFFPLSDFKATWKGFKMPKGA